MKSFVSLLRVAGLLIPGMLHAAAGDSREAARLIDAALAVGWQQHQLKPNPPASDETFVRRIYLDIIGRIPTLQEAHDFLDSRASDKRALLIDRLLASEGHARHMFAFWADLLRVQTKANGGQGEMTSKPYVEHVKQRIRENQPYDQFVRELLSAQGKVWHNPAIGYYMRDLGMPLDNLANTTRVFLGTRIDCAQCHNHPFDKWTQMQFYQMAAFTYPLETNFTGIAAQDAALKLKPGAEKNPELAGRTRWMGTIFENLGDFVRYSKVQALPSRQVKLPHDYKYPDAKPLAPIAPKTMLGEVVTCAPGSDTTKAFADWITSPQNPRFTTVIANRLWKKVFGLGLIEPVDELMDNTVAVDPQLMQQLEHFMRDCHYDLRAYLRILYNTQAYQREATRAELIPGDKYYFTGPVLRRMSAEQMWDSFITLIHPTPDLPQPQGIDADMAERLTYKGKLSDALDLLDAREIFDGTMKASLAYESSAAQASVLKDQYTAAQKAKDKALMEKLNLDIRTLSFSSRTGIHDHIVVPAVARLYTQKTGKPAPPPIPVKPPTSEELKKAGPKREYIPVPGYETDQSILRQEETAQQAREAIFLAEAERFAIPSDERPLYLRTRRTQSHEWMRAADLDSPAPRGHYLREFGQSDRDMIDNASTDASVSQALVLMNSTLFAQITQPYTQLRLNLRNARSPEEQLEVACQTLLTRLPTDREKALWKAAQHSGLHDVEDLLFALVNTQQFIFVQ
ncbi:MAG: hypothetical protein JWO08_4669 [Verrucomicrobiaceae bacterium]|nr:hypothetical protein [Verrucomicrobiaceae bacterium]